MLCVQRLRTIGNVGSRGLSRLEFQVAQWYKLLNKRVSKLFQHLLQGVISKQCLSSCKLILILSSSKYDLSIVSQRSNLELSSLITIACAESQLGGTKVIQNRPWVLRFWGLAPAFVIKLANSRLLLWLTIELRYS